MRTLPAALAVAALVLSACGSEDPPAASPPSESLPPADGLRAPTPVRVAGTAGAQAAERSAGAATDMMIAPAYIEYVLGDVGELPTNTTGYVFPAGVTVGAEQVAAVAAALGIVGDPVPGAPDSGTSWQVGPTDGTAPSLSVSSDAQLTWWYNGAWAVDEGRAIEPCSVTVDSDGNQLETCPEPEPPVGILTEAEAEARARELLTAMGEDPASFELDTYADEWFANVSATRPLDGFTAPIGWGFGFGENGSLQYANGSFAVPQPVGPYPLVDLDTAFARLQDQGSWGGWSAVADVATAGVAEAGATAEAPAVEATVEPAMSDEPMPVEPGTEMPAPEPIVVTLVDVEADLWWAWDEDGSIWLLPAYRFVGDDEGWYTVPAVADEFLIIAEPQPVPMPEPLPVETTPPVTEVPAVPEPAPFDAAVLESSVGLTLAEFTAAAEAAGATVRVVEQDGTPLAVTEDYRLDRVNVAVEGDTVVRIDSVG